MSAAPLDTGIGVIVVAERVVYDLLAASSVPWNLQERQTSVSAMWDGLSGGRLSSQSRILVFSDSLMMGSPADDSEVSQTARAIVAMAHAGARVFVASTGPSRLAALRAQVDEAARVQGLDPASVTYDVLELSRGGRALLDLIKERAATLVPFPAQYPDAVDAILAPSPPTMPQVAEAAPLNVPALPPLGVREPSEQIGDSVDDLPPPASRELLARPKLAGQATITVTSSKGGSGKTTAAIMLAASIARASRAAGKPLSVCLIDLDTRDGQVASLIGTFMPTALNIRVQPVWDEERIRRNLVRAEPLGIDCLLAPIRPRTADTVGPDFYRTIVRSLQRMYDVIVMDTSVQYLEPLIAKVALVETDEIVFVTNLASTAVQGMARALREITAPSDESGLGIPREKIGIMVNQSVANVGMGRDQVLAAGLGIPVIGVIPLATKDVLTATNLNRMHELLEHPLIGPAYVDLARACLPGHQLASWAPTASMDGAGTDVTAPTSGAQEEGGRKRGLFRR